MYFCKNFYSSLTFFVLLIPLIFQKGNFLNAEYLFEELQIESSTKTDGESSVIPNNPFEIVEMIRRNNSLNDATNPSDAIDNALESFSMLGQEEEI